MLDKQLAKHEYVAGAEFTIADMAIWPWVSMMPKFPEIAEILKTVSVFVSKIVPVETDR